VELASVPFQLERELEDLVAASPSLIAAPSDPRLALVRRQVGLPGGGFLDVLLVDAAGTPVVVEVKLARNGQARREVVGQVVDYVSLLTSMTVDELDHAVTGALEAAIRSFLSEPIDEERFDELWRAVGVNLRAGSARYVIVLDEAPPELERIVRFLAVRSNLDVSLVTLQRYRDNDGHMVVVPQHVVRSSNGINESVGGVRREISAELQAVVDAFSKVAPHGLVVRGQSAGYRQIQPPSWPSGLHYEFLRSGGAIAVDLHIESDAASPASSIAKSLAGKARSDFPYEIKWDQRWSKNRGRLTIGIPIDEPADVAAKAMVALIELSLPVISAEFGAPTPGELA
jgi:hypothetical protein